MSPSLSIEEKADRLLVSNAVKVSCVDGGLHVVVQGDHGSYTVRLTRRGPSCSCPSWRRRCSHVVAVERIVGGGR